MSESTSNGKQNAQSAKPATGTEADAAASKQDTGKDKSSHDHMSRDKAGSDKGAGGGAKQEQKHN